MSPRAPSRRRRPRLLRPRLLRLVAVAGVAFLAFLYYRPLHAYFATRHSLAQRQAEVHGLEAQKRRLERRLTLSASPASLELEARRLALVRPGERLFIVKGIAAWRRRHHATIGRGGCRRARRAAAL